MKLPLSRSFRARLGFVGLGLATTACAAIFGFEDGVLVEGVDATTPDVITTVPDAPLLSDVVVPDAAEDLLAVGKTAPPGCADRRADRTFGVFVSGSAGRNDAACGGPDNPCKTVARGLEAFYEARSKGRGVSFLYVASGTYGETVLIDSQVSLAIEGAYRTRPAAAGTLEWVRDCRDNTSTLTVLAAKDAAGIVIAPFTSIRGDAGVDGGGGGGDAGDASFADAAADARDASTDASSDAQSEAGADASDAQSDARAEAGADAGVGASITLSYVYLRSHDLPKPGESLVALTALAGKLSLRDVSVRSEAGEDGASGAKGDPADPASAMGCLTGGDGKAGSLGTDGAGGGLLDDPSLGPVAASGKPGAAGQSGANGALGPLGPCLACQTSCGPMPNPTVCGVVDQVCGGSGAAGCGGNGGSGGKGGSGGGSSVGIFVRGATVSAARVSVRTGDGGRGGRGGAGGIGGKGAAGATGAPSEPCSTSCTTTLCSAKESAAGGAPGTQGGAGGLGGAGGPGGGGHSFCVVSDEGLSGEQLSNIECMFGAGGAAGSETDGGPKGDKGRAGLRYGIGGSK
jgi:hypothetical protein